MFRLYIISSNNIIENEAKAINALFDNGMTHFHLRKKTWMKNEVSELIDSINTKHHSKIVLHSQFDLIFHYDLAGFHFNSSFPYQEELAIKLRKAEKSVSVSSHNICDMGEYELESDYQFVSPIFPSISKPDYTEVFDHQKLKNYFVLKPKSKFIALGGIEPDKIELVKQMNFDGFAVMGFLWQQYEIDSNIYSLIDRFNKLKSKQLQLL